MITVLCTVGTSLLGNLKRSTDEVLKLIEPTQENAVRIAARLRQLEPTNRECGAEINSTASLLRTQSSSRLERLVLFTSDTSDGRLVGDILRSYFMASVDDLRFRTVEVTPVTDLNDEDRDRFRTLGLRTLVRLMTEALKRARSHGDTVLVNATGGYKAQIAYATLLGQLLKAPVFYQFERFTDIIEMPVMPVAFDLSLWLEHADLLNVLETSEINDNDQRLSQCPSELEPMLHRESGSVILSALGTLYNEAMREQFRTHPTLPPASNKLPGAKKITSSKGHHRPKYIHELVNRLTAVDQVDAIHFEPGQPTHENLEFKIASEICMLKVHVKDVAGMQPPCTLALHTTAHTKAEQAALRIWLTDNISL
jgi:putative CRISPR-associated protein (TIGR02619 family)